MKPIRVFITGGAGYLGSVLCEHLLKAGYHVTVLDNLLYGQHSLFHFCSDPNFDFYFGDARDERLLKDRLADADVVIPLACIVGMPACECDPIAAKTTNLDAIASLDKLRSRQQLVVFPTTNSGYGAKTGDVFCTEETPLEPISLYGEVKAAAEKLLLASPNTITLRLATVFGMSPRMRLDLLVNHFTYAAVTDRFLVIFEKDFKRNFVHVRDVADCFLHCLANSSKMVGRCFNVGLDSANVSKAELAQKIKEHVPGFYLHYAEVGQDPDKRNYIVSSQRLRQAGFAAVRTLDAGIPELIKGYQMMKRLPFKNV